MRERAPQAKKAPLVYSFGLFRLDPGRMELSRGDVRLKLQEQPMRLLIRLVASAGEVVTRDDLYRELWPADTFVAFDAGLSTAVKKIRQALGDAAANPRFIETIPRHGYRFIAPVQILFPSPTRDEAPVAEPQAFPAGAPAAPPALPPPADWRRKWPLLAGTGLLLAAAWFVFPTVQKGLSGSNQTLPLRVTPLTGNAGWEMRPAVSPDGTQVAFAWNAGQISGTEIYVAGVHGGDVQRLTPDSSDDDFPCWSPDGSYIAYVRHQKDIMLIPSRGGEARKLGELTGFSVAWSPDGNSLIYGRRQGNGESSELWAVSVRSGERHQLSAPVPAIYAFMKFGFSPDGSRFGFSQRRGAGSPYSLYAAPAEGGSVQHMAAIGLPLRGWAWLSDREIVVATRLSGRWGLARLRLGTAASVATPLRGAGEGGSFPSIAIRPGTARRPAQPILAYERSLATSNLYSLAPGGGPATRLLASASRDGSPQISPDERSIVLVSNRSGPQELWKVGADGSHPVALTTFGAADQPPGSPKWAPDSRQLVFDVAETGRHRIYTLSLDGGPPRPVVNWDCETLRPTGPATESGSTLGPTGRGDTRYGRCRHNRPTFPLPAPFR